MTSLVIAIDGPGGVGKSTVSRRVAAELAIAHLDTGAFYRAATLVVVRAGIPHADPEAVAALVGRVRYGQSDGTMTMDGEDVSAEIRSDEVTARVSEVSAIPAVRALMVGEQRRWVEHAGGSAVVEGRDIGTVVFPAAPVKVYLDADPEVRAMRRSLQTSGVMGDIARALSERDRKDAGKPISPMVPAADAVIIDTTHLGVDEVVAEILSLVRSLGGSPAR